MAALAWIFATGFAAAQDPLNPLAHDPLHPLGIPPFEPGYLSPPRPSRMEPRPPTVVIPPVQAMEPALRLDLGQSWYVPSPLPIARGAPGNDLSRARVEAAVNRLRAERDAALSRRNLLQAAQASMGIFPALGTLRLDEEIRRLDHAIRPVPSDPIVFDARITPTPLGLVPPRSAGGRR